MAQDDDRSGRLSGLGERIRGVSWPEPAAIRSGGRRRRRRRAAALLGGATAVVAAGLLVAVLVVPVGTSGTARYHGASGPPASGHVSVGARSGSAYQLVLSAAPAGADPAAAASVAAAEQAFGLELLQRVAASSPGRNVTVSPESLAIALAMLETGAKGETEKQIASTLHTSSLSALQQDAGWATLASALAKESTDGGFTLHSANSLWVQKGLPMVSRFVGDLVSYFASGVWQVDFANHRAAAEAAINAWVSNRTARKIRVLFGPGALPLHTLLVLANAVYLKAAWEHPFLPALSAPGQFYVSASETSKVTFMQGPVPQAASTPGYQLAVLPYKGGELQAVAVMPITGSLESFVSGLTTQRLDSMVSSANQRGRILMPRFTTTTYTLLKNTLVQMGMVQPFDRAADFSAMSKEPLKVGSVVQRDFLSVGEKGTEAAAATGIGAVASSSEGNVGPSVDLNHPFLLLIRDASTGTILFASEIRNPAAP